MKISVVTISYNQAAYLQTCIDSVAAQKGDWEHIIVDPGSTDGSRDIIESNRSHFSHIVLEKDEGPADGLNKGFALASGTHGFFINSDDFILPNAFSVFSDMVAANPRSDVFLCGGWLVDGKGAPIRRVRPTRVTLDGLFEGSSTMFQQGMLFSMRAYNAVGGFNNESRICWDFELLCDFLARGYGIATGADRVGAFRVYPGSISDPKSERYLKGLNEEHERISHRLRSKTDGIRFATPAARARKLIAHPWILKEVFEKNFLQGKLKKMWLSDLGKTDLHSSKAYFA